MPPTIAPHDIPKVKPAKKTVIDINSKFGINIKAYPNPIEVEVKIAALTRLFKLFTFI